MIKEWLKKNMSKIYSITKFDNEKIRIKSALEEYDPQTTSRIEQSRLLQINDQKGTQSFCKPTWRIYQRESSDFKLLSYRRRKNLIPEGAFSFEAVLSDESINMNGYRILLSAWQEGFANYFSDYEGLVYLQHDMDQPIGKTLDIAVDEEQGILCARGFAYDDLTEKECQEDW